MSYNNIVIAKYMMRRPEYSKNYATFGKNMPNPINDRIAVDFEYFNYDNTDWGSLFVYI